MAAPVYLIEYHLPCPCSSGGAISHPPSEQRCKDMEERNRKTPTIAHCRVCRGINVGYTTQKSCLSNRPPLALVLYSEYRLN